MCDTRFPLTHKFKNLKESALSKYQQKNYQESKLILSQIPIEKMDLSCKVLLAKTLKMCHDFSEAKELLSNLLLEQPDNLDVLKEKISLHLKTHEYQKALYYFSQLFSIETDHTNHIRHILNLYHKLGLYDRSYELLETLDKNGFPHELFLSERIDLAIHTADIMTLSKILTRYRNMLQNIPELLCKVLRNIEVGVVKNLKDELFLKHGSIHLGSYLDTNTSIEIYDSYYFDLNSFYESLLRFTDYVKFHKMKFSGIQAYDQDSQILSKILSAILGLNHSDSMEVCKESTLVVGFDGSSFQRTKNAIYFFLQCPNHLLDYPEFFSQVVQKPFQSFIDLHNKNIDQVVENLLNQMQSKKHISSLTYAGQEILFTRFDHFKLDKTHTETRQNIISLVSNQNQNVFSERSLDHFDHSIKNDQLLYINSYIHKKDLVHLKNFESLCQLHKQYNFCSVKIPTLLFEFDPDRTLNFYFTEFQKHKENLNFVDIFYQLNHYKTQEFQLQWFDIDSIFHQTMFSKFEYWSELEEHHQFYPLLIKVIQSTSATNKFILKEVSGLQCFEKLTPILEKKLLSQETDIDCKYLIFTHLFKHNLSDDVLLESLTEFSKPHTESINYLLKHNLEFPDLWINWLQKNREDPQYLECILRFSLFDFFKSEWQNYWKNHEKDFLFDQFYKISDMSLLQWIEKNIKDHSNLKYQKFLLLNHSFYPHLRDILMDSQLKIKLSKQLIQTYSKWVDNSPVKDLLFLMLSDDESKILLAKQYFLRGDIEYYMFLVNRFFTHGHKYGQQIICSLFEFRSDKAIQLLNEGIKQDILTWRDTLFLFDWIDDCPERKDELLSFLQENEMIKNELINGLLKQLQYCPKLLHSYINLSNQSHIQDICYQLFSRYPNHHKLLKEFSKVDPLQLRQFLKKNKNTSRFSYNFQNNFASVSDLI